MRREVFLLGALGLAMLAGGTLPREPERLPPVSAPPPALEERARDSRETQVIDRMAWRHTGLARDELRRVARAIVEAADRHELDVELVLAVIQVESGGYNFAVSSVGALGLMQIMPRTGEELARRLGLAWHGPDTLFDPVVNVQMGVAYLRQLQDRYQSWPAALAAYNWGPARIDRRLRRGARLPSRYAEEVLRFYEAPPEGRS